MLTEKSGFGMASGASIDAIKKLYAEFYDKEQVLRQMIRNVLSATLRSGNHTDDNPLECTITLCINESVGLSSNDMPLITGISETEGEGILNLWIDGMDEPMDFDILYVDEQMQVLNDLLNN